MAIRHPLGFFALGFSSVAGLGAAGLGVAGVAIFKILHFDKFLLLGTLL